MIRQYEADLQEGVADSCHVVFRRITRKDETLHDLNQVWHGLETHNANTMTASEEILSSSDQDVCVCV